MCKFAVASFDVSDKWCIYKHHFIKSGCHRLPFGTERMFFNCSCQKSWPNELVPESSLLSAIDNRPACISSFTSIDGSLDGSLVNGSLDGSLVNGLLDGSLGNGLLDVSLVNCCCVGCSWISVVCNFFIVLFKSPCRFFLNSTHW